MTVREAMKWLDLSNQDKMISEIEDNGGINAVDIVVTKLKEAMHTAYEIMELYSKEHRID